MVSEDEIWGRLLDEAAAEMQGQGTDVSSPASTEAPSPETGPQPELDPALQDLQDQLIRDSFKHGSQARVAHVFAARNLNKLMHVHGLGWFAYDGMRWFEDTGQAQNALLATLRSLWSTAMDDKQLRADVTSCQKASALDGVLKVASRLPGIAAKHDDLDADPYLLNCLNGTLDLRTLVVRPHDPADRITKICNASYDPAATSGMWDSFLGTSLPNTDVRGYFQRFAGLSLIGEQIEHIFTIATGEGRNGKGVAYETLIHVLGDYACVTDPSLFEQNMKASSSAPRPDLLALRAVRLLVTSETEKQTRIASAFMKRLTGGDPISARGTYEKKIVTFEPSLTPLMVTNHLPKLPADDPAVWERTRVIPFDVVVPKDRRDPRLKWKLKQQATDAVLAWAVRGLADYLANGLGEPAAVADATAAYAESQDDVKTFVDEMCTEVAKGGELTTELHMAYEGWAFREGISKEQRLGRKDFAKALEKLGHPATRSGRGMVHKGLIVDHGQVGQGRSVHEYLSSAHQQTAGSAVDRRAQAVRDLPMFEANLAALEAVGAGADPQQLKLARLELQNAKLWAETPDACAPQTLPADDTAA